MRHIVTSLTAALLLAACSTGETEEAPAAEAAPEAAAAPAAAALTPEQVALTDEIRTATAKYQDVAAAQQDGYMADPTNECVDAAMVGAPAAAGAMGIHYFRPDLLGIGNPQPPIAGTDAVVDPAQPEVLVYEPQADGSLQLVAAEYLVFTDSWSAAGNAAVPSFAGQPFATMADDAATPMDEAHGFTPHHELHVWVHRENPAGVFAEFNPSVTCAHHHGAHAAAGN